MRRRLVSLDGATVRPDGKLIDQTGRPTGLSVSPGGFLIFNTAGQRIGTLSMAGRVYDGGGNLVTRVTRLDTHTAATGMA
ncbi:MAG: hypothetical protein HGA45_42560 [Chloroflexales bacterium]|nr:hypothetical protein [Chloroflexales bacterium]